MSDTSVQSSAPSTPFARMALVGTLTMSTMLYAMTVTIANVALPKMQGEFGATQDQIAWVVTFNIVATAVMTPLTGWLIARLGQRRLMLYCVVGFGVSTFLCGIATSLAEIVIYRVLQGLCGAPMVPTSQSIVLQAFPKDKQASTMSIFGMGVVMGPIIAPTLGGYLSEEYGWRWIFFMVVPCAVAAFTGVLFFVRDLATPGRVRLDWTGFLTLSIAVAAAQLMLDRGERNDWFESTETIVEAALAALCLYLFVVHSLTSEKPFLNFALFRDRNYAFGMLFILVFGMLNFTPMVLFPPLLQQLRGFPEGDIGILLAIRACGTLAAFTAMIWLSRFDPRIWMSLGFALQGFSGLVITGFDINVSAFDVAWTGVLQGFGTGLAWVPTTMVAFATLAPKDAGEGSAVFHLVRNFGSSFFISVSVAVVIRTTGMNYAGMTEFISPFHDPFLYASSAGAWSADTINGLAALSHEVGRQSAMIGYLNAFYLYSLTALAVIPFFWMVKWRRPA
ncbi:MAG: DHA2 family efflux MFS transporter permease subunit [Pseudomonadota bacterium]|nr:DHA2 family efflux MFS transporter permease subunit [Pseudomonadota bacterium]